MIVPRAFQYHSSSSSAAADDEKRPLRQQSPAQRSPSSPAVRGFGWRPASFSPHQLSSTPDRSPSRARSSAVEPAADRVHESHHSQPVAVPSSRRPIAQHMPPAASLPDRGSHSNSSPRDRSRDSRRLPSTSVANVLASTSIPRRTSFPRRQATPSKKNISIADLVEEWKQSGARQPSSPGTSPAMDMLLSAPDDADAETLEDIDDGNNEEEIEADTESVASPRRTTSSNSVPSLDDSSSQSGISFSVPPTPSANGASPRGRERIVSSPQSVDVGTDHPLNFDKKPYRHEPQLDPIALPSPALTPSSPSPPATRQPKRSFRSNLTASLKSLASRTFSNFAAPSTSTEPISLLVAPYQPEMRPRPLSSPPTSAHRRYMNPHAFQPYAFHLHNHALHDADLEIVAAENAAAAAARAAGDRDAPAPSPDALDAIPMEVVRKTRGSGGSSQSASSTEAGRARISLGAKREPRENPEFLRIAVLELQMRRAGKTEGPPAGFGAGAGRRGWWLVPREVCGDELCGEWRRKEDVPARWVATGVDDPEW